MEKQSTRIDRPTTPEHQSEEPLAISKPTGGIEQKIAPEAQHHTKSGEYDLDVWESRSFSSKAIAVIFIALWFVIISRAVERPAEFLVGSALAIFVGLIALNQYYISKKQWYSMQGQLEAMKQGHSLTEEMFYVSERAYMCISKIKIPENTLRAEEYNRFKLTLFNGGRTPAFNVRIRSFQCGTTDSLETIFEGIQEALKKTKPINIERMILAGKAETIWFNPDQTLSVADHALWEAGKKNVFIPVELSYEDVHRDTQRLIYWYQFFNNVGFALRKPLVLEVNKYKKRAQKDNEAN